MMTTQYLMHTTVEGERWDSIAAKYYGDAALFQVIANANESIPMTAVLPVGLVLMIPIIERIDAVTLEVPPWLA
jgi:nucleoid-associated protein YgaU